MRNILITTFSIAAIQLFLFGNVSAQTRDTWVADHKVKSSDLVFSDEVMALSASVGTDQEYAAMRKFLLFILTDDKVLGAEHDLLLEIDALSDGGSVQYFHASTAYAEIKPLMPKTLQLLKIITEPSDFNKAFNGDKNHLIKTVKIFGLKDTLRVRPRRALANRYYQAWRTSTIRNGYEPLTGMINNDFKAVKALGGDDAWNGRQLIFEAVQLVDTNTRDSVPDFIYNWVKPAPKN